MKLRDQDKAYAVPALPLANYMNLDLASLYIGFLICETEIALRTDYIQFLGNNEHTEVLIIIITASWATVVDTLLSESISATFKAIFILNMLCIWQIQN